MPSLKDLENKVEKSSFVKEVTNSISKFEEKEIDLNAGIKTSEELTDHIKSGDQVNFNYTRLINESGKFA